MVDIRPTHPGDYFALLCLLNSQKSPELETIKSSSTPKIGFIAEIQGAPVAMGFLRMVEGGYAQIDGLTSNANLSAPLRNAGVSTVVDALLDKAKSMKLKGIISFTQDNSVIRRAKLLGFRALQHTVIVLPIESE